MRISELSWGNYENDRACWKPILLSLAWLATNDIVLQPN
jgi:hypothetical protein